MAWQASARVLDHEEHNIGVCRQDQPQLRLSQHQPCQPPAEETEEGLNLQSVQLARKGAPRLTPRLKLTGSVRVRLSLTRQSAEAYSTRRKPTNWGLKPNARRVLRRYRWSTRSKAFS
ncbi:unnamed protein product [Caretta caretta]